MKCGQNHEPNKCSITETTTKENLYCLICKQNGHPASYKGCPQYKNLLEKLRKKKNQIKENKNGYRTNEYINPLVRFSSILKNNKNENHKQNNNDYDQEGKHIRNKNVDMEKTLQEILTSIKTFSKRLEVIEDNISVNTKRIDLKIQWSSYHEITIFSHRTPYA